MTLISADVIVLGAGIYGLYAARHLARQGRRVVVLECDREPGFGRGSWVNQARLHNGYHYPRSLSTAQQSAASFERFRAEFDFAIQGAFEKIYAIARHHSLTNGEQFQVFCQRCGIPCEERNPGDHFNPIHVEAAFRTEEYSFDAPRIADRLTSELEQHPGATIHRGVELIRATNTGQCHRLTDRADQQYEAPLVINATYASTNQLHRLFDLPPLALKYELCEVILADVPPALNNLGLTLMDGPFFSLMPFGFSGHHSLTTVGHTPHQTSYDTLPTLPCQDANPACSSAQLDNCNHCPARPTSAWPYMAQLAGKYLKPGTDLHYRRSLFTIKPILQAAELDDARPTLIESYGSTPRLITVFSGKINGFYHLTEYLDSEN